MSQQRRPTTIPAPMLHMNSMLSHENTNDLESPAPHRFSAETMFQQPSTSTSTISQPESGSVVLDEQQRQRSVVPQQQIKTRLIPMSLDNVHHALEIQKRSYPLDYNESEEAFESMATHYGSYSFLMQVLLTSPVDSSHNPAQESIMFDENEGFIGGYIVSHPGMRGKEQALDEPCSALTGREDCWYLHDCCLSPEMQGKGLAKRMVQHVEQLARDHGFNVICLVSVQNTYPVWQKVGYRIVRKLEYGGLEAYYMEKMLD